jgi:hypothetical protein
MSLFVPIGLDMVQLLTEAGQSDLAKALMIDKLHYIIDRLYLNVVAMNHDWRDFMPLHSQVLGEVLGTRDAPAAKKILLALDIIQVREKDGAESYEPAKYSKGYRFSKEFRGKKFHAIPIQHHRFAKLLDRKHARQCSRFVGDNSVRNVLARSIREIDFDIAAAEEFLKHTAFKSLNSENAYKYAVQCFRDKHWLFAEDAQGRLYNNWSQMSRKLRRFASHRGRSLYAADVSACQPCLLSLLYEEDCDEKQRYVEIVKSNLFYPFLNDRLEVPYDLSDEDRKGAFKQEVFHRIFYGSNRAKPTPLSQVFADEFPILASLVRRAKRVRHRDLPVLLQKIEADVVINDVATELVKRHTSEDFCLITVHDCLVTTQEYLSDCEDCLRRAFRKRLGFEPTVKIKQVTEPCLLPRMNRAGRDCCPQSAGEYRIAA